MPVTEVVPKKEFFDYEAKYTEGLSDEITPARMPEEVTERIQELSSEIYDILGCRGIVGLISSSPMTGRSSSRSIQSRA